MAGIQGKNTAPEIMIRRGLHARGFRFRLHDRALPGRPDLVLAKYRAVIEVHGCFWHGHGCHLFKWPSSRKEFWSEKILSNVARDKRNLDSLNELGWRVLVIWECAMKGPMRQAFDAVVGEAARWLESGEPRGEIRGTA